MVLAVIVTLLAGWLLLELAAEDSPALEPNPPAASTEVNLGPPGPLEVPVSVTILEQPVSVSVRVQ